MTQHTDFERNELKLGDEVITNELAKRGGAMRRGEIIRLNSQMVKVRLNIVCPVYGTVHHEDVNKYGCQVSLVRHNPEREAELLSKK